MSKKTKIILVCVFLLLVISLGVGVFLYFKKTQQVKKDDAVAVSVKENPKNINPTNLPKPDNQPSLPGDRGVICGSDAIKNLKQLENNKRYLTRVQGADQSAPAYFNDYLLCALFVKDQSSVTHGEFFGKADGFSQASFANNFFAEFSSWGAIFKSVDCSSAQASDAVANLKKAVLSPTENSAPADLSNSADTKFMANLRDVSSPDLCGFFKRNAEVIARFEKQDFCAGDIYCKATIADNVDTCKGLVSDDDKRSCRDNVWYQRALRNNDMNLCSNVETAQQNIACQAYFLGDNSDMCNGLINEINDKFCK